MKKSLIAFDLDDVLAAHVEAFIDHSNSAYGTSFEIEDYTEHWPSLWGIDEEEMERRAYEFHTHQNVLNFKVKDEAQAALSKLSSKYDLCIVTARRRHLLEITRTWVEQHFPNVFNDIHFVPIWEPGNKVTKAEICKQIGADFLVDDLARHCNVAAEGGIKTVMFGDYSWNRNDQLLPSVTRCVNWQELLDYFEKAK